MRFQNKITVITCLLLVLLLSISVVSATKDLNESTDSIDSEILEKHVETNSKIEKNNVNTNLKSSSNALKYIYVNSKGNSSSDGSDFANPTTIYNAFKEVENDGTIMLTGDEEVNYYNITENITTKNLKTTTKTFTITSNENSNIILNFYSGYCLTLNGSYNIKISNISLTRNFESNNPLINNNVNLTIDGCSIYNVKNSFKYGAIYNNKILNINNSNFYNNVALREASVIYSENATVNINNSVFENNSAEVGAVLSSMNSKINLTNTTFNLNNASFGGVFSLRDKSQLNATTSRFNNNHAKYNGGVIDSWYSTSYFNNSLFVNNSADYGGVVSSINNERTSINNSLLENNIAYSVANNVYSYMDNLTLFNNVILNSEDSNSIYCFNSTHNLNNNWWGTNNPNFSIITNNIMPNNWRLMNIKVDNETDSYKITVSINQLSDSKISENELYERNIFFNSNEKNFQNTEMTISKETTFELPSNLDNVEITIDNQKMKIFEKITPYLNIENESSNIDEKVTFVVRCNPDISNNIIIKVNDDILTSITPVNGTATYTHIFNSTWLPGTYNINATLTESEKYISTSSIANLTIKKFGENSSVYISKHDSEKIEENVTVGTRFNLNSLLNYQTSIKDQGKSGSCWAFSTLAALESAYLKVYGIEYNFSENNMKNNLKKYSSIGDITDYPNKGNNELEPISYLVGWYGPVDEIDDPYDDYSIMSPLLNNSIKVEDVYFFYRTSYTGKDNKLLKEAILKYGALSSSIYSSYSGTSGRSLYTTASNYADHAITIVGWDDFYSNSNFYGMSKPSGSGAYIIKNSWGEDVGTDGYQYVSYYDTSLAGVNIKSIWGSFSYAFPVQEYENYTNIYQHDTISTEIKTLTPEAWIRNVYTATKDESIAGVGTYIYEATDYEAYIYVNDKLSYFQSGNITQEGYRIIKLANYIPITKGDIFRVDLKLKAKNGSYTSITVQNTNKYKSISKVNQSFISTDGETWQDLYYNYDYKYTAACLKVYTKETPLINSSISQTNMTITTTVNNLLSVGNLTFKINDEYYTDKDGNIIHIAVEDNDTYTLSIPTDTLENKEYNITIILDTKEYTVTENHTLNININETQLTPLNVIIKAENIISYVDAEQKIVVKLEVENDTDTIINEGTLIIFKDNEIIEECIVVDGKTEVILNENEGNYTYTLVYNSDSYSRSNVTVNVTIIKHDVTFSIPSIENNVFNENMTIKGRLSTEDENISIVNAKLYVEIGGENYDVYTDNNGIFTILHHITKTGLNEYNVKLYEDDIYYSKSINGSFLINKQNTTLNVTANDAKIYDNINITGTLTDIKFNPIENTEIIIKINNEEIKTTTNNHGMYNINYTAKTVGENTILIIYQGNENYTQSNITTRITIEPLKTIITINEIDTHHINEEIRIEGKLTDEKGNKLSNEKINITINDKTYDTTTDTNGTYLYRSTAQNIGTYDITATFEGNECYINSTVITTFEAIKENTIITINPINEVKYGEYIFISGTFTDETGKKLTNSNLKITINNKTSNIKTDTNGTYTYTTQTTNMDINNVTVQYSGNTKYDSTSTNTTFTVKKQDIVITINSLPETISLNDEITLMGTFTDKTGKILANSNLKIMINNETTSIKTDSQGMYSLTRTFYKDGLKNITISYNGNYRYNKYYVSTTVLVKKQDINITLDTIPDTKLGNNFTFKAIVTDNMGQKITDTRLRITVNSKIYYINTNKNGEYELIISTNTIGTNNISVENYDNIYNKVCINMTFKVIKQDLLITIDSIKEVGYGGNVTITGKFTDANGKILANSNVRIVACGKKINVKTDANGLFTCSVKTNAIGENKVTASYLGNDKFNIYTANATYNVVKNNITIIINSIKTDVTNKNTSISGIFMDNSGNPLPNSNVRITVNGKNYNVKTGATGTYNLTISNLAKGLYNVTASYGGSIRYNTFTSPIESFDID